MLWVYGHSSFLNFSSAGSESDVYRRQILMSKDGPRAERVNPCAAELFASIFHSLAV